MPQSEPGRRVNAHLRSLQCLADGRIPRADFHMHTTWTDGENSVSDMYKQAVGHGIERILFSEHARKTSGDWFPKFAAEVRALPKQPCEALVGVECKVESFDGKLDVSENIRHACDLVMASVHRFPGETVVKPGAESGYSRAEAVETEFRLAMAALRNPGVDILGHPFGMCYRRFGIAPPPDLVRELIRESARTGVAFEINARYHPNPRELADWCVADGAVVSLGSNAHKPEEIGRITRILLGQEEPWSPSGLQ